MKQQSNKKETKDMKRIATGILAVVLLLGSVIGLPVFASAKTEGSFGSVGTGGEATVQAIDPMKYTYEVIPLLEPFNTYFFVKTENPDPHSFRFADHDSIYSEDGKPGLIELYESYSGNDVFADVVYENVETLRVKGGYIFWSGYTDTDGGKLTLQTPTYDYWGYIEGWKDTGRTLTIPKLRDDIDYLIDNYCQGDSFFDKMDAIQSGLSSICLYSGNYIRGNLIRERCYWKIYRSPYVDQLFYIGSPYQREDNRRLFASYLYPLVRDSLGFPSTMAMVALRLDDKATYQWSSSSHAYVDVTYNGVTRTYGGQGNGKGQGIAEKNITKYFTFGNDDMGISLESLKALHSEYAKIEMEDDVPKDDMLTWRDVTETVGYDGAWVRFDSIFTYLYKADDSDYYHTSPVSSEGGSLYWGGSLGHVRSAWIDGRHVDRYDRFEQGATFEEYPHDAVILTDVTYPVFTYRRYYVGYDQETGTYKYEYRDVTVTEHTGILRYDYNEKENTWEVFQYPEYNSDGTQTVTDYATAVILAESGLIDTKYADMLRLTYDQVLALGVDRNTDLEPERGYNYGGTVEAGTPFDRSAINTGDLSVLFADAKAIAEKNKLNFRLDKGHYGMCGEDMYWVHLQDSETLIITGTGDMATLGNAPWYFDGLPVQKLIIGEGVESLQYEAFAVCTTLKDVTLPSTLKKIEQNAFYFCVNLPAIEIPAGVTFVGKGAFTDCVRMTDIYCLAKAQPAGWRNDWLYECDATVHWGTAKPCDHVYTTVERKDATCTEAGYEKVVCNKCGETDVIELPATGHSYRNGVCTVCGEEGHAIMPGDVTGDGVIDATDYLQLKRAVLGTFDLSAEQKLAADVTGDGVVDALDYLQVKRHVLGTFTIG